MQNLFNTTIQKSSLLLNLRILETTHAQLQIISISYKELFINILNCSCCNCSKNVSSTWIFLVKKIEVFLQNNTSSIYCLNIYLHNYWINMNWFYVILLVKAFGCVKATAHGAYLHYIDNASFKSKILKSLKLKID